MIKFIAKDKFESLKQAVQRTGGQFKDLPDSMSQCDNEMILMGFRVFTSYPITEQEFNNLKNNRSEADAG